MPRSIRSMNEVPLNPFEALKRAYIKHGYIPRYFSKAAGGDKFEERLKRRDGAKSQPQQIPDGGPQAETKPKESGESYPEKVAEGESDKNIESENDRKLKSEKEGSKTAKGPETLPEITKKSLDVLYEASTVFPFTLVPDTITLDREKLTIANRVFWRMADITSVPVGEIMSCEVRVGPFFGSLNFTFRFFTNNERVVNFLWRQDAIEMQRLIHGYIIAHRREIDVSSVPKEKLIELLKELGQGASS
jgi:hypothetical protein